jgi:hypothetical protein
MRPESQNWDTESQNWDASLYIDLQTDQTLSEGENEKKAKISDADIGQDADVGQNADAEQIQTAIAVCEVASVDQNSLINPNSQGEENSSAACTKKSTENFNWLPDGPWSIEGKLDPNFRDWLAKEWQALYGGSIHQKRADVLRHFRKDPANLAIRWEQYHSEFLDRVQKTQILLSKGIQVKPEIQDKLIANQRALTAEFPAEMNPVQVLGDGEPGAAAAVLPASEVVEQGQSEAVQAPDVTTPAPVESVHQVSGDGEPVSGVTPSPEPPSGGSTPPTVKKSEEVQTEDGKRLKVFQRPDATERGHSEDDRDPGKLRAMVDNFLKSFSGGPSRTPSKKPETKLEQLNRELCDPILRESTIAFANHSGTFTYCPDLDQIIEAEEM